MVVFFFKSLLLLNLFFILFTVWHQIKHQSLGRTGVRSIKSFLLVQNDCFQVQSDRSKETQAVCSGRAVCEKLRLFLDSKGIRV